MFVVMILEMVWIKKSVLFRYNINCKNIVIMSKKLELIRAAWVELIGEIAYDEISKYMIDDGWCLYGSASDILFAEYRINIHRTIHFERSGDMDRIIMFRPKKIEHILYNKGWLHLDKKVLETITDTEILICFGDNVIPGPIKLNWVKNLFKPPISEQGVPTHYKPYVPELPPIF